MLITTIPHIGFLLALFHLAITRAVAPKVQPLTKDEFEVLFKEPSEEFKDFFPWRKGKLGGFVGGIRYQELSTKIDSALNAAEEFGKHVSDTLNAIHFPPGYATDRLMSDEDSIILTNFDSARKSLETKMKLQAATLHHVYKKWIEFIGLRDRYYALHGKEKEQPGKLESKDRQLLSLLYQAWLPYDLLKAYHDQSAIVRDQFNMKEPEVDMQGILLPIKHVGDPDYQFFDTLKRELQDEKVAYEKFDQYLEQKAQLKNKEGKQLSKSKISLASSSQPEPSQDSDYFFLQKLTQIIANACAGRFCDFGSSSHA